MNVNSINVELILVRSIAESITVSRIFCPCMPCQWPLCNYCMQNCFVRERVLHTAEKACNQVIDSATCLHKIILSLSNNMAMNLYDMLCLIINDGVETHCYIL